MRTEHHDFIFQSWISARQFGDDVVAVFVVIIEPGLQIHAQFHRHSELHHARDQIVVLSGEDNAGQRVGSIVPAEDEHCSVHAHARSQYDTWTFLAQHLSQGLRVGARRLIDRMARLPDGDVARRGRRLLPIFIFKYSLDRLAQHNCAFDFAPQRFEFRR